MQIKEGKVYRRTTAVVTSKFIFHKFVSNWLRLYRNDLISTCFESILSMCWIDLYQIEFYWNDHTPHDINITLQTNRTERPNFTNGSRPTNHDHLRHLSLPADKITAKMTNQFLPTGLGTFDWQKLFTCLWWWLPLRLSKRQSPLPTIVLIRTKLTHTIKLHYYILLYYNLVACR